MLLSFVGIGTAQRPKQKVRYDIEATLNTNHKTVDGQWDAVYVNLADTALHVLWIVLSPNAFASDRTHYSEDLLQWGNTRYYFGSDEDRGWIDSLAFTVDGSNIEIDKQQKRTEFIQLPLPYPLQPGDSVHIATTFFTQLPYNFENNGYRENDFVLDTWCPDIAKLDSNGWLLQPYSLYLNNETANAEYTVKLHTPSGYHVKTNGLSTNTDLFQYSGDKGFKWIASRDRDFIRNYSLEKTNLDSIRTSVAKKIFPDVFHSGKAPQYPAQWLGQVYKSYQRPVPFLTDSLYWKSDTSLGRSQKLKLGFFYSFKHTDRYRYLFLSPAVGFNNYDKVMVGALIHNYQLPQAPFSFVLAPTYAAGSKRFAGWGNINYNIWNERVHWQIGVLGNTYSMNEFNIPDYPRLYQRMWRVVPSVNVTLLGKDAASAKKWDLGFRTFLLSQQRYNAVTVGNELHFENLTWRTNLFQFKAQVQDTRKLYPYSLGVVTDAGKDFVRLGLTGKYFFNYDASSQGVAARLFAGKFFYLKSQSSLTAYNNAVYNFTLNGPGGAYDYTYSGYFVGRSESNGWMSQQLMERDGFFKLPGSVLLYQTNNGSTLGLSDDWLAALNLAADIPDNYNFLKPVNGTLKLFFDIGTYSDLWRDQPAAGRFLYDAGIQVSLCKSLVNVYVPVLYSKVFRDRYKNVYAGQSYFWKTISFNINLSALQPRNRNFLWPQ
ncbi:MULTISPECIES: hypothetical protein [Chitinophagaceae]